jgi:hypothetical protein
VRVTGTLVCLFAAAGIGLAAAPAAAQPDDRLDVEPIVAALDDGERIIRAPDTVARFDEALVREELGSTARVVVLPYVDYDHYRDENDDSQYFELVREPILEWALAREVPVVLVEGLDVTLLAGPSAREHQLPADLDELRTTTATRVVTERLLVLSRLARGLRPEAAEDAAEDAGIEHPAPVPPPPERLAEVAAALRGDRTYNAPGRADPVEDWVAEIAREEQDIGVRIAAFPVLEPGQPVVDYATGLKEVFPDDVVMVLHGDWLDIAAPDQHKALAARAFAYGDADLSLLNTGSGGNHLLRETVKRLALLLTETSWGYPQPPPQPRALPFDVQRTVSTLAPWVLVGSAVVLGGATVLRHRARAAGEAAAEERALRAESASAMAAIGDLGARVLSTEERGGGVDPAAAERHATARLLYDQAHTSVAMAEVRRVAEEGLALLVEPEPVPVPTARTTRAERRRRKAELRKAERARGESGRRGIWKRAR